jgi:signal peptidase I
MNKLPPETKPAAEKKSSQAPAPAKICFRLPSHTPPLLQRPVGAGFIFAIVIGVIILRGWLIEGVIVDGNSMYPTLHNGQRLLVVQKHYNSDRLPRRGDIVVLRDPQEKSIVVKRVIALPGEYLIMFDRQVRIDDKYPEDNRRAMENAKPISEPYAHGEKPTYLMGRLPSGTVWVLGDNRDDSADSRVYGPVPLSDIRGRAVYSFWPPKIIPRSAKPK